MDKRIAKLEEEEKKAQMMIDQKNESWVSFYN